MLSREGKPTDSQAIGKQVLSATHTSSEQGLNREQIFRLIESIFSFEACLYHQILPLKIEDNKLLLGMVNLQDSAALDYVSRILSYLNCTMVTQLITGETHRTILSAYLNYKNTSVPVAKGAQQPWTNGEQTVDPQACSQPNQPHSGHSEQKADDKIADAEPLSKTAPKQEDTKTTSRNLPVLLVPNPDDFSPVEVLTTLPPKKLLEQLLGRVLAGGIGRLYLERLPYSGRILWSENGVLQSVLEELPLSVFQGVLNELKRFGSLPLSRIAEPKQIEKECLHQQNHLLLRLRVMPGMYGEEATLQVLRGAALKFYQQQQLARLGGDALGISQQLGYKLHELQQRLLNGSNVNSRQLEAFNALKQLLNNLDYQIKILTQTEPPSNSK